MTDVERIAKEALTDPRTVRKYLLNEPVRPMAAERIRRAIQTLNLQAGLSLVEAKP